GRGNELGRLEAVCSQAKRQSRPAVALVNGVPGSGKTRLLAELRGREVSSRQLSMVGYQTGPQVPLPAAGDLLRELVKVSGAGARLEAALFRRGSSQRSPARTVADVRGGSSLAAPAGGRDSALRRRPP